MSTGRYSRRGLALTAAALLTTVACTAATAAPAATAGPARAAAPVPGWRVVKTIGPDRNNVSGLLTSDSARDAWSVWTGSGPAVVLHWTGSAWTSVPRAGKAERVRSVGCRDRRELGERFLAVRHVPQHRGAPLDRPGLGTAGHPVLGAAPRPAGR